MVTAEPLPPLATTDDLEVHLGRPLTDAERPQAEQWLAAAAASIRRMTGQDITLVLDDEERHDGRWSSLLQLDQLPVQDVAWVEIEGEPLAAEDWRLKRVTGALWLPSGWWWAGRQGILVKYSHGFLSVPADLITVNCSMVGRAMTAPEGDFASESLGPYRYDRRDAAGLGAVGLTAAERAVIDRYTVAHQVVP